MNPPCSRSCNFGILILKNGAKIKYKHVSYPFNRPVFFCQAVSVGLKQLMPFSSADISPAQKGIEYDSRLKLR
jgi:hypothetical protein